MGHVILANTPQFLITITYYFYNNLLTSMLAAAEYSSYSSPSSAKPLRVTSPIPHTAQKSTYFLSIPYQYTIPVLSTFVALHWTISESLFYGGQVLSALGYSPIAIFVALLIRGGGWWWGWGGGGWGSCSVVISAACHLGADGDGRGVAEGRVRWGEMVIGPGWMDGGGGEVGHCGFTSGEVLVPVLGREKMYA
ncbi:hypothetical protein BO78DRAFT_380980 [Aspergillus sclerotiicarbonarius CBS 121057]|uniref:Uncharacterized protein n=1 Tax=Aspergillus sclerotiicarbonarius (strain CBS 121057 / IBT 28362) TaxID=1448318 RepID=A0A319DRW5_ASPSB|nr:hypothetical protein BO78DRAFT_380980 [Aspergillus sclerotiicarbonarius CBS 121057]